MNEVGQDHLRRAGVVVMDLLESTTQDPRRLRPHYHSFFQVMLLRGRGMVMHDFREYPVRGHALFFVSPGQVHTLRPTEEYGGNSISFTQSFYDHNAPPPSDLFSLPFFAPSGAPALLELEPGEVPPIAHSFAEIYQEFQTTPPLAAEALRALLHLVLVRIARVYGRRHPAEAPQRSARLVREYLLAVEREFRNEHKLSHYARELGVTENHLNDMVREHTGQSAGALIRGRRLLDAKRLLSHSDLGIAEIGYQTGFADPSYFSRFFRSQEGLTPQEFREQIREKYQ
jgi:AraC-like DNA-binding protein